MKVLSDADEIQKTPTALDYSSVQSRGWHTRRFVISFALTSVASFLMFIVGVIGPLYFNFERTTEAALQLGGAAIAIVAFGTGLIVSMRLSRREP